MAPCFARLQADTRFEPLPVFIDQRDRRNWNLENAGGEFGDVVERFLRQRIEHGKPPQLFEPLCFIGWEREAHGAALPAGSARGISGTAKSHSWTMFDWL